MGHLKPIFLLMGAYLIGTRLWSESKQSPTTYLLVMENENPSTGFPQMSLDPYKSTFRYRMPALLLIGSSMMMKLLVTASSVDKATSTSIHSFESKRALPSSAVTQSLYCLRMVAQS
jgi:hypothetical protein